jgi:hypothetical protein
MNVSASSSNRRRRHRSALALVSALLIALASGLSPRAGAQAAPPKLVLLTPDEAAELRFGAGEWPPRIRPRAASFGPRVVVEQPNLNTADGAPRIDLGTPARLVVRFEENQAPVDMGSLEVNARKGFFSKSLTSLLKPYLRGTTLQVEELQVPEGNFLVEIQIADTEGSRTLESYRLQVTAP